MVSRYFFALCALAMFAAVVSINVEQAPTNQLLHSDTKEKQGVAQLQGTANRDIIDDIVNVLQEICTAAKNCLKDVTIACKNVWLNPIRFLRCVKKFVEENHDKCKNPGFSFIY